MVLLSKNYLIQCTTCMKSASMNAYFIALIAFKIQNLIIFKHPWFLPFFASSKNCSSMGSDGQSPKLIFSTSIILIILLPKIRISTELLRYPYSIELNIFLKARGKSMPPNSRKVQNFRNCVKQLST